MQALAESAMPPEPRATALLRLLLANFIPLYGLLFLGWDARLLIFTYFLETLATIAVHALRLWAVHWRWGGLPETQRRRAEFAPQRDGVFLSPGSLPLFLLAIGLAFSAVQLLILGGFAEKSFPEGVFTALYRAAKGPLAWAMASFLGLQIFALMADMAFGKLRGIPVEELFFRPAGRIFVQQFTVILGAFALTLGADNAYAFVLLAVKTVIDLLIFFFGEALKKTGNGEHPPEVERDLEKTKNLSND